MVHYCSYLYVPYHEALAGRSTDDLLTSCTYSTRCVRSGTLLFHTCTYCTKKWYTTVHTCTYGTNKLAVRSTDDLQTYCTYQVRTQWYTTVHTCTYCTKQLLLGGAWMILICWILTGSARATLVASRPLSLRQYPEYWEADVSTSATVQPGP